MTEALLRTRMTLAETCTGETLTPSVCRVTQNTCFNRFLSVCVASFFSKSALTQFFQIFPEYQANDFYATGEVRS